MADSIPLASMGGMNKIIPCNEGQAKLGTRCSSTV